MLMKDTINRIMYIIKTINKYNEDMNLGRSGEN